MGYSCVSITHSIHFNIILDGFKGGKDVYNTVQDYGVER